MTDALDAAPLEPQTDTLVEQTDIPRPAEVKTTEEPKSLDDTLRDEVEKAVKGADKPEKKEPDEAKVEAKPEKPEPEDKNPPEEAEEAPSDDKEAPKVAEQPERKPTAYKDPPSGFDDAAKAEWESVPESVRGAMHRRAQEMERGIEKYRADATQFEAVREFHEMAERSGTDLATALQRYTGLEQQLRQNPMQGLQQVVANLGLTKPDGTPITLRDVAASIMGQSPDRVASQNEATISALNNQIAELKQQIGGFSKHVQQQQQQAVAASAAQEWTSFVSANPRAAELESDIAAFLHRYPANLPAAQRLNDAYNWAIAQKPSVAHTDPKPLAQTQTPDRQPNPAGKKSVSGAGGETRTARNLSSDEAIKRAIAKLNG